MEYLKKNIAIVCGGDSSEHDVSMRSGEGLYSFFDKDKYNEILKSRVKFNIRELYKATEYEVFNIDIFTGEKKKQEILLVKKQKKQKKR